MQPRTQSFPDPIGQVHIGMQRPWQHSKDLHRVQHGVPALRGASGHEALPLTKTLFAINTSWQRESKFSPGELSVALSTTLRGHSEEVPDPEDERFPSHFSNPWPADGHFAHWGGCVAVSPPSESPQRTSLP